MKKISLFPLGLFLCATSALVLSGCNDGDNDTKPPKQEPVTYTVTVLNQSEQGADIKVVPSKESIFYCSLRTSASLVNITDEALLEELATIQDVNRYLHSGTNKFTIKQPLTANESYTVLVAGYDGKKFTGDIDKSQTFTVVPPAEPAVFAFEIGELTFNAATIFITPKDVTIPYFAEVKTAKFCDAMTDEQFTAGILNLYGSMAEWFTYTGPTSISSADDFGDLIPDTDYYVMAFGYAGGNVATELVRFPFRTKAPADPATNTFKFESSNIGGRTASVKVTPTEPSVLYVWNVITDENYKKYGGNDQAIRNYLADYIKSEISETFPTPEDVVSIIGVRGENGYDFESLNPETTYYTWAVCVDASGKPTAEPAISAPFTTLEVIVSTATATLGIDKFYDGSELYKIDPVTYKNYNGKVYLPVVVHHSDDAKQWYTIFTVADVSDSSVYTDDILIKNLVSQGTIGNDSRYYYVPWSTMVSFVAVAQDADGNFGPVFRKVTSFDPSKVSPISDLGLKSNIPTKKPASVQSSPIKLRMD